MFQDYYDCLYYVFILFILFIYLLQVSRKVDKKFYSTLIFFFSSGKIGLSRILKQEKKKIHEVKGDLVTNK